MKKQKTSLILLKRLMIVGILVSLPIFGIVASVTLWYAETKGPFKNSMQVVDWEADGDLDVIVSHTRWESKDISWAGIGSWINQGNGTFELVRDRGTGTYPFRGFAAGAGDVDQDGDLDVFTQDFSIRLMVNQGGAQAGQPGDFKSDGGINLPSAYNDGYRDMGGTIELGDMNGDGRIDAFVAGCCYGMNPTEPGYDDPHAPSVSWVWINHSRVWTEDNQVKSMLTDHILPMDSLDGQPIREAELGDLDGDGDLDIVAAVGKPTMGTIDSLQDLILLNDGTGRLAVQNQHLGDTDSTSVALGDVNGDGRLDALVGTNDGARLWINQKDQTENNEPLFVPTHQSFQLVQTLSEKLGAGFSTLASKILGLYLPYGSVRTKAVFLVDLDGDGDLDGLLARVWQADIWWNDGIGMFHPSNVRFKYQEDTGVALADFDGDGDQDVFIGRNEDYYQVWWNDGHGAFSQ